MKKSAFIVTLLAFFVFLIVQSAGAQLISPKAKGTSTGGPTIDQAQSEDAMGPKARVAVTKFTDKSAKGQSYGAGDGMAEMLANALFATNRYIVLERGETIGEVLKEQDFGASGRVKQETAAKIGEIEGADLLIEGTITEFAPDTSGGGGGIGGLLKQKTGMVGNIFGGMKSSHVALIVKVIDAKTGRRLASEQVEGKATDVAGGLGLSTYRMSSAFSGFSNTPMEKAIRICIEEAVKLIVAKTPPEFFREGVQRRTPAPSSTRTSNVPPAQTQKTSTKSQEAEAQIVYVKWPKVTLREGPAMNSKPLAEVQKGTALSILEVQGQWIRVSLEDGSEGWVGKATTSENP